MIKNLRVTVDGKTYEVTVEVPEEAGLPPAPSRQPAAPTAAAAAAAIAPATQSPPPPASPSVSAGPGDIPSPLSGRVTAVIAQVGQSVLEGDHLLTLEAMKMNTFIFAPRSGKVIEIKVAVGAAVDEGQTLARME